MLLVSTLSQGRGGTADPAPATAPVSTERGRLDDDARAPFALGQLLRSAHHRASVAMLDRLRPLGLELRHVAAMIELAAHGPISQRCLVDASDMDKATLVASWTTWNTPISPLAGTTPTTGGCAWSASPITANAP
jgi:hypothetical protein